MSVLNVIVIHGQPDLDRVIAYMREHAPRLAKADTPLQVALSKWQRKRTTRQNAYLWAVVLQRFADEVTVSGRRYTAEVWAEFLKREHLPEVCSKGVQKWDFTPDGERVLTMSTTDLNVEEMNAYIEKCQAHGATEHGITFAERNQ